LEKTDHEFARLYASLIPSQPLNAIDGKLLAFFQLIFRFPGCNPKVTKFVAV
jgi:hypothetical protein